MPTTQLYSSMFTLGQGLGLRDQVGKMLVVFEAYVHQRSPSTTSHIASWDAGKGTFKLPAWGCSCSYELKPCTKALTKTNLRKPGEVYLLQPKTVAKLSTPKTLNPSTWYRRPLTLKPKLGQRIRRNVRADQPLVNSLKCSLRIYRV